MADNTMIQTEEYPSNTMIIQEVNEYSYIIWREWTTDILFSIMDFTERLKSMKPKKKDIVRLPSWIVIT